MFCSNCGYDLKESKIKSIEAEAAKKDESMEGKKVYVCPRCGKIISNGFEEADYKALSQAAHAEVHRANNAKNGGLCSTAIGSILIAISILFLFMSFKAANAGKLDPHCIEFSVFCVLCIVGTACLVGGLIVFFIGLRRSKKYSLLITNIQNKSFVQ
jgi:DNA-directed RNA polymerase subunit RPC12/RpoP/uncharacterized integral membrane protein